MWHTKKSVTKFHIFPSFISFQFIPVALIISQSFGVIVYVTLFEEVISLNLALAQTQHTHHQRKKKYPHLRL